MSVPSSDTSLFDHFLFQLRAQELVVGMGEWLAFLQAMKQGLATSPLEMYALGRSILCRTEADYDQYDVAFAESFADASLSDELRAEAGRVVEQTSGASRRGVRSTRVSIPTRVVGSVFGALT